MTIIAAPRHVFAVSSGAQPKFVNVLPPASGTFYRMAQMTIEGATATISSGDGLYRTFRRLADEWHNDTDFLSSPTRRTSHPNYLKIISLGRGIMHLILRDLEQRGGDWYIALEAMLQYGEQSPVPADANGNLQRVKNAWLQWGYAQGML